MQDEDLAKQWAADINEAVSAISCRPKTLLVIVNPWGGNGRANNAWNRQAYPIFTQAGSTPIILHPCRPQSPASIMLETAPEHLLWKTCSWTVSATLGGTMTTQLSIGR